MHTGRGATKFQTALVSTVWHKLLRHTDPNGRLPPAVHNPCDCRYVFNNVLVLPEYIVDFMYDVSPASPLAAARTHGSVAQPAATAASAGGAAVPSPGGVDPTVGGPTFQAILDSLDADIR